MANVNVPFGQLPTAISLDGTEVIPLDQGGTTKKATARQVASTLVTQAFPATIEYVIDSGGATMSTGTKGYLEVPFTCTVSQIDMFTDQTGSCVVDIWRCTYAQFDAGITHPVAADSICGANIPTITAGTKTSVTTGPAVGTTLNAGDILAFNVNSVSTVLRITISTKTARSIAS